MRSHVQVLCLWYSERVLVLLSRRSEIKMWSPLASDGEKTNPYKMNLESQPQVCVLGFGFFCFFSWIPLCLAEEGRSYLRVAIEFLHACTFFNHWAHNSLWVVPLFFLFFPFPFFFFFFFLFFTTANDEVIVYFPTGGCLGDASLSAERWRNPQFLPTWVESWGQSVKSCRPWRHVFRASCVFHRCALFLTCTKATCCQALLWSLSLWCFGLRVCCYYIIGQCVLFKPTCSWRLLKHPVM